MWFKMLEFEDRPLLRELWNGGKGICARIYLSDYGIQYDWKKFEWLFLDEFIRWNPAPRPVNPAPSPVHSRGVPVNSKHGTDVTECWEKL